MNPIVLLPAKVELDFEPNDLFVAELEGWLRPRMLQSIVQKFFPQAKKTMLWPVGGGWSGTKLCRIFVQGEELSHFFKFFTYRSEYLNELIRYPDAKQWLGPALVNLKLVPDIEGDIQEQSQAFPPGSIPEAFPVCYESASGHDSPRETLQKLYRTCSPDFAEKIVTRLLQILARQPTHADPPALDCPWGFRQSADLPVTPGFRQKVAASLEDLNLYGPPLCNRQIAEWEQRRQALKFLLFNTPVWLNNPEPVLKGCIHGDPNPRNCLVLPENFNNRANFQDFLMIDSGGFRKDGRLVSDLAVVERDIKLVLMGTEACADRFLDLDTGRLRRWCLAEQKSIRAGIDFGPSLAPKRPCFGLRYSSEARAYRLVGLVRQRAKELCGDGDPWGKQYFAALLFWTLDALKYEALRPTKKLLALYSASEILSKFGP